MVEGEGDWGEGGGYLEGKLEGFELFATESYWCRNIEIRKKSSDMTHNTIPRLPSTHHPEERDVHHSLRKDEWSALPSSHPSPPPTQSAETLHSTPIHKRRGGILKESLDGSNGFTAGLAHF
jgi:hypothetical protein